MKQHARNRMFSVSSRGKQISKCSLITRLIFSSKMRLVFEWKIVKLLFRETNVMHACKYSSAIICLLL